MKNLIIATIISGVGLGISDYFKFDSFMYFIMGGIAYGIFDFITDIKTKRK